MFIKGWSMKTYNTRFCPTVNGSLTLGHAMVALVNEYEAHRSGGNFVVIFDNNQPIWKMLLSGDARQDMKQSMADDLEWLGLDVDQWIDDAGQQDEIRHRMNCYKRNTDFSVLVKKVTYSGINAQLVGAKANLYPYDAWLTLEKVVLDSMFGINLLIRGVDLMTESSLYSYFCDGFGIPLPEQVYLPRLEDSSGKDISKTGNPLSIRDFRNSGTTALQIRSALTLACLKNAAGDWSIDNIKSNPKL
jgi:glutamyl/glutaminyl-tRNA synthetase